MKKLYFLLFTILITSVTFAQSIFINEIHYDNGNGGDVNEGFEIAGPVGSDLTGWTVAKYNGSNSTVYGTENLMGVITDQDNGFGTIWFGLPSNGLQNGDPDGIALVDDNGTVIQFLSYEGVITAADGPAMGMISTDIGVSETNSTPIGESLQLTGTGTLYGDFTWNAPAPNTNGMVNTGQSFIVPSCAINFGFTSYACDTNTVGDNNDSVIINIPYTGSNAGIASVSTTAQALIGGDDPATVANGTITLTGLSEGDAWDITLNGGDCDGTTVSGTVPAAECDPLPNTCFDLSNGMDNFELITVTPNSQMDEWSLSGGTYSMNGFCGGGCIEAIETWMVFGPIDMTSVTDLALSFDAAESFGITDLNFVYTSAYSGCPSGTTWTPAQTIMMSGSYDIDLSMASGTQVYIGVQYMDDGADGYSGWTLTNVTLDAFGNCPVLGTVTPSNCAVCDLTLQTENYNCTSNTEGANNDTVIIEIPYTGMEATITSITTTSMGVIGGDDPTMVADGTITITGLGEGDAWDLTINGGDCDGTTISGMVIGTQCDPTFLIINEINADPSNNANNEGDANGDGTVDPGDDEFVEIYNTSANPIVMDGYVLSDGGSDRHVFPMGTTIPGNSFITVFGGGTPTDFSSLVQTASTTSLSLNNGGDTITLKNDMGVTVTQEAYSNAGNNQSIARDPDFTGAFVDHSTIVSNPVLFSPGEKNDGTTLSTETFEASNFSIYPNPTNTGFVNIKTISNESINVTVFNIIGKQIINQKLDNNTLNVSNLNSGVYLLKLTQNGASTTKKLVIE